jgi:hypothetical protein
VRVGAWISRVATPRPAGPWRCILALNTTTAIDELGDLDPSDMQQFGRELGEAICAGATGETEMALCATMPQTADVALLRLATESPALDATPYHAIVLLSADGDLRGYMERLVTGYGGVRASGYAGPGSNELTLWRCPNGLKRRAPTSPTAAPPGTPPENLACYTLPIDSFGLAGWAYSKRLDLEPGSDMRSIATQVQRDPWLLSQIGLTTNTVRGVSRFARLGDDATIGPCGPRDGVEVRGTGGCAGEARHIRVASVGIGAARLDDNVSGSVATRLPVAFLRESGAPWPAASWGSLEDARILQRLSPWAPLGAKVRVVFERGRPVASVRRSSPKLQPEAWWILRTECRTDLWIDGLDTIVPYQAESIARAMPVPRGIRFPNDRMASLALRCPDDGPVDARVDPGGDLEVGQLGQGWVGDRPAALLPGTCRRIRGTTIRCIPWQEVPSHQRPALIRGLPAKLVEWLQFLPVLVAI